VVLFFFQNNANRLSRFTFWNLANSLWLC